ncbi:kinase-like protein [Saccharata proteae CBS 121410]|uniref:Kinase-like protein n=1 Tax=Saccharata proteae CBS 121410 TaxID=1314787 RepID=A0A9P4HUE0_9PEZI|nr:kinase-like protein [Saccharata proteae CBS 121410]
MAAASPTPLSSYTTTGRMSRQHGPIRPTLQRRDSPMSILSQSQGFTANAPMMQRIDIGDSDSDEEIERPMALNPYTAALLRDNNEQRSSPERVSGQHSFSRSGNGPPPKLRISRQPSAMNSPMHTIDRENNTPALNMSLRVKRVQVRGAPMRRIRRTPQGDEEHIPILDQENMPDPRSTMKADSAMKSSSMSKVDSMMKSDMGIKTDIDHRPRSSPVRASRPVPLASVDVNTPRRPAPPPPPPKMSVLDTATAAAGASTVKQKKRRRAFMVNGKPYQEIGRIGKGGSSDVYRVMAENGKLFALKRVKLEDADENAVRGYKGEIELLKKLEGVERVVRLFDWEVDEEKQILSVLMDIGESDLARILRMKTDHEDARLDLSFTRYYWKEMLCCVSAVHDYDIVHSDLKPANFLLIQGALKLIDFGIANAIDVDHTVNVHRDSHVGTPNYMSPESLQDANAGARHAPGGDRGLGRVMKLGKPSDVWSLGCILYQMIYGRAPFAHIPNQIHRVMAIVNPSVEIEYPSHGLGGVRVPVGLKKTMKRCLLRDPARRPTIPQLLAEDDEFLYPDGGDDLRIPEALLGQIIQRVADRFRDQSKGMPSDEEIGQYPASFYAKIRSLMEEVAP